MRAIRVGRFLAGQIVAVLRNQPARWIPASSITPIWSPAMGRGIMDFLWKWFGTSRRVLHLVCSSGEHDQREDAINLAKPRQGGINEVAGSTNKTTTYQLRRGRRR